MSKELPSVPETLFKSYCPKHKRSGHDQTGFRCICAELELAYISGMSDLRASPASQDKVVEAREVWLVGGSCGQYDEHREWVVGFSDTKEQAEAVEKHLEGKFKEYMEMRGDEWDMKKYEKADKFMKKHDPFHENNSDDTQYFAYKVDRLAALARLTPGKEGE